MEESTATPAPSTNAISANATSASPDAAPAQEESSSAEVPTTKDSSTSSSSSSSSSSSFQPKPSSPTDGSRGGRGGTRGFGGNPSFVRGWPAKRRGGGALMMDSRGGGGRYGASDGGYASGMIKSSGDLLQNQSGSNFVPPSFSDSSSAIRYFVVKAPKENLLKSRQKGVWATQKGNEGKLMAAYRDSEKVILLFSPVRSNRFHGYCRMASQPAEELQIDWKCPSHISLGHCFRVDWECLAEVDYTGRPQFDCQELAPDVGSRLCRQLDEAAENMPVPPLTEEGLEEEESELSGKFDEDDESSRERGGFRGRRGNGRSGFTGLFPGAGRGRGDYKGGRRSRDEDQGMVMGSRVPQQPTRYFIIKGLIENFQISLETKVWCTSRVCQRLLEQALDMGRVMLLFSPIRATRFKGFCRMDSKPTPHIEAPQHWKVIDKASKGDFFEVSWYCTCDIAPTQTDPNRGNKLVTSCADCQEISQDLGHELCQSMWDIGEILRPPRNNLISQPQQQHQQHQQHYQQGDIVPQQMLYHPEMGMMQPSFDGSFTRYFVVRAPRDNLDISLATGLWATQRANETKLATAFRGARVLLLFSATHSTRFQGFCRMISLPDPSLLAPWRCPSHLSLSSNFGVEWICLSDVSSGNATHFDCQELPAETGFAFCQQMLQMHSMIMPPPLNNLGGMAIDIGGYIAAPQYIGGNITGGFGGGEEGELTSTSLIVSHPPPTRATRFFVVKSDAENQRISLEWSAWAVSRECEQKLASAYSQGRVILLFSPARSNSLNGFFRMDSPPCRPLPPFWSLTSSGHAVDAFDVSWYCTCDVVPSSFTNPWNNNMLVTLCCDGQEVPPDIGNTLCQLMWEQGVRLPTKAASLPELQHQQQATAAAMAAEKLQATSMIDEAHLTSLTNQVLVAHEVEKLYKGDADKGNSRYFIVKTSNENIHIAMEKNVWATNRAGQELLDNCVQTSNVILLFSPSNSDTTLSGYCTMEGMPSPSVESPWKKEKRAQNSFGDCFTVRWYCKTPIVVPSDEKNPLTGQLVTKCRDCQEVDPELGQKLCALLHEAQNKISEEH